MLEYQLDQIDIVDFLLLAKFWACALFFTHPLVLGSFYKILGDFVGQAAHSYNVWTVRIWNFISRVILLTAI